MTEIVKHQPVQGHSQALSLASMSVQDAWGFAKALAESSILPRQYQGNAGSVLWALEFGRGLGLDVITTIQSVHIIQGRATMSADLMASLCRRSGHRMRVSGDDQRAEVTIFRSDDPEFPFRVVWDMAKATRAKLAKKDVWQEYPAAMLRARAISECVRMACPEVLHGAIYTPEERGAVIDEDGNPVDAPVQQLRPVRVSEPDQWATPAATVAAATAGVPAESLTPGGRDYLHEALAAPDAATVRLIWQDARGEGARPGYLQQIAEVGKQKAAIEHAESMVGTAPADDGVRAAPDSVVDGEVVDEPDDEHAAAVAELRAFAAEAGIDDIDTDAYGALGAPLADVSPAAIRGLLNQLRGTAA